VEKLMDIGKRKVVIVGGGISGLSAAFYTKKLFEEQQIPVEITIVEKSEQLGGKIRTLYHDGFVIEKGPDSFLARKLPILTLTKELGLEDELRGTNPNAKRNFILYRGKLHQMPLGFILGIPTKMTPFIKTGLISPAGKIRAAMDFILPKKKGGSDESLGNFIQRRLGKEVLENITEPLLAGIYAGDTQLLSLNATFPQFSQLEQKHRSLILGMMVGKKKPLDMHGLPDIARKSMFLTYKNGLMTLVDGLVKALSSLPILTRQEVTRLQQEDSGYKLTLDHGTELHADGLIMAIPTFEAAKLLPELPSAKWLEEISYVSVANIALVYKQEDIQFPLNGSGFVIPRKEGRGITACTWSSSKWQHVAPAGSVLLRTYVGRSDSQEWVHLSDEELLSIVRKELQELMGITAQPAFSEISRCNRSMPQYPVGHTEQLTILREQLREQKPGVFLCGGGFEGVGIPDCIAQGKKAAEQLFAYIESKGQLS
jgi:oxygen-dependent protoporphyrinogen oxidase